MIKEWNNWLNCTGAQVIDSCPDTCRIGRLRGYKRQMFTSKGLTASNPSASLEMINEPWLMSIVNAILIALITLGFLYPIFTSRKYLFCCAPAEDQDKLKDESEMQELDTRKVQPGPADEDGE